MKFVKKYFSSKIITRVSGVKVSDQQNIDDMQKFWGSFGRSSSFCELCSVGKMCTIQN